jgi:uncharacterized protein YecE (DUF72 family)
MKAYIGCSGWSYPSWKEVFYPPDVMARNYLAYYASHFSTVEVNSTFYRFPTIKTVRSWANQVPDYFKFSLKASRLITHMKRMRQVQEPLHRLYGLQDILQDKVGYFLFQFPANFHFTAHNLEQILTHLDPIYKNVLEFRHASWWCPEAVSTLQENHLTFCTVSGLDVPTDLMLTQGVAYIRFHGDSSYAASYSEQALSTWAHQIQGSNVQELWVYFNNTSYAHAVSNAITLKGMF